MSKASTRKRNRITLALGAFSMLTFGSLYGVIASTATGYDTTMVVASVPDTSQTTALVLTDLPASVITPAPTAAPNTSVSSDTTTAAATPAATVAPTPVQTTHTTSRGS